MSNTRHDHPGYYGVILGAALPWYMGLGAIFTFYGSHVDSDPDYDTALTYVPIQAWGAFYLLLGVALFLASTIPRVPHGYVRFLMAVGWCCTFYFEVLFIATLIIQGLETPTIIAAWGTILIVEFKAIVEPTSNPLTMERRRRTERHRDPE